MSHSGSNSNGDSDPVNDHSLRARVDWTMRAARAAQIRWAMTPMRARLERIRELRRLVAEHGLLLAKSSAAARQRPALESLTAEVLPLAEACRFLERHAEKLLSPRRFGRSGRPIWLHGVQSEILRDPLGVVLIIGPGNYPLLLPGVQLIQALVAGNSVLLKPGFNGTRAAEALIELVYRAGFDPHLVALLPESTEAAETAIEAQPDKVLFTGSAATGEKILSRLSTHLIPVTMELSGLDAVIVRADADLDLVTKALRFGLALNDGATCLGPRRLFAHRSISTELEGRLAQAFSRRDDIVDATRTGKSNSANTATATRLRRLLDEAIAEGAHYIAGGIANDGSIQTPVIMAGLRPSSRLLKDDIFAPVLLLVTIIDDADAIFCANNCPFALGSSIFTRDESAAQAIATHLTAGVVTVNDLIIPTADARIPFSGRKRSGFGVTRGAEGLLEMTTPKVVTVTRGSFRPAFEPTHANDESLFAAYLKFTHGVGIANRIRALVEICKSLSGRKKKRAPKPASHRSGSSAPQPPPPLMDDTTETRAHSPTSGDSL